MARMKFDTILFDLDGTLANTIPDLAAATNAMLTDMGRDTLSEATVATYVGNGVHAMIARALQQPDEATLTQGMAHFAKHYKALNGTKSRLYDGVLGGLEMFRNAGAKLGVVTNKDKVYTMPLLRKLQLDDYFGVVVSGDTCSKRKPDPEPIYFALQQLGSSASKALFVGDSVTDAKAAQNAGIPGLILPYGYHGTTPLSDIPATAVVDSLPAAFNWAQRQT